MTEYPKHHISHSCKCPECEAIRAKYAHQPTVIYKSREYCKDINCPVQHRINEMVDNHGAIALIKIECKLHCRRTANEYHQWLKKHGFIIIKETS